MILVIPKPKIRKRFAPSVKVVKDKTKYNRKAVKIVVESE